MAQQENVAHALVDGLSSALDPDRAVPRVPRVGERHRLAVDGTLPRGQDSAAYTSCFRPARCLSQSHEHDRPST